MAEITPSHLESDSNSSKSGSFRPKRAKSKVQAFGFFRVLPGVSSSILFLSGFFSWLAPLPLLALRLRQGLAFALLALGTNSLCLWLVGGRFSFGIYLATVGTLSLVMPVLLLKKQSLNRVLGLSWMAVLVVSALTLVVWSQKEGLSVGAWLNSELDQTITLVMDSLTTETRKQVFGVTEAVEIRSAMLAELPSAVGILSLLYVWANLVLVLRLNVGGIRLKRALAPSFFRDWKIPEFLVWPSLATGALLLWGGGSEGLQNVVWNLFRVLMAVYVLHGLSILSFFLDAWKMRGGFRALIYGLTLFIMMPAILGLGFFDLWFDFRAKLRQS